MHWQKYFFAPLPGRTEFRLLPTARKISTSLIENGTQQTTAPEKETVEIKTMGSFSVNRMNEARHGMNMTEQSKRNVTKELTKRADN